MKSSRSRDLPEIREEKTFGNQNNAIHHACAAKKIPRNKTRGIFFHTSFRSCIQTYGTDIEALGGSNGESYVQPDFTTFVTVKVKVVPLRAFFFSFELSATCP